MATSTAPLTFVNAAPGSGKTFMSVERFGWLRYHHLAHDSRGIAAVSFARSASAELRYRIASRWGSVALDWPALVGTFDELHRRVLRNLLARGLVKWPDGHIMLTMYETWRRFPNARLQGSADLALLATLDSSGAVKPGPLGGRTRPRAYYIDELHYVEQLRRGLCTHDEVRSVLSAAVVDASPDLSGPVTEYLQETYSHLLVDEAFDLNRLDTRIVELVAAAGIGLTLVGDPWQSIFEWRGSTPKLVHALVDSLPFKHLNVKGSHRYRTDEMQQLSEQLILGNSFSVREATPDRRPDVVLADRWASLWGSDALPILPSGFGRIDSSGGSAALIVLLNDFTMEMFGVPAADIGSAVFALDLRRDRRDLAPAREVIADPMSDITDVWLALYEGLRRPTGWGSPGKLAAERLQLLMDRVRMGEELVLGTSTHQAKGLQWPKVDYVTNLVQGTKYRLQQEVQNDRHIYVALTRAQDSVRTRPLPTAVVRAMRFERTT